MRLSLRDYLWCGHLEGIRQGTTKAQIEALLGPPKTVSVGSRKNKKPAIYVYDSLEIYFSDPDRAEAHSITFNTWGEPFHFPDEWIIDNWDLQTHHSKADVLQYLSENGFSVDDNPIPRLPSHGIQIVGSGVRFWFGTYSNFGNDNLLWGISGALR